MIWFSIKLFRNIHRDYCREDLVVVSSKGQIYLNMDGASKEGIIAIKVWRTGIGFVCFRKDWECVVVK